MNQIDAKWEELRAFPCRAVQQQVVPQQRVFLSNKITAMEASQVSPEDAVDKCLLSSFHDEKGLVCVMRTLNNSETESTTLQIPQNYQCVDCQFYTPAELVVLCKSTSEASAALFVVPVNEMSFQVAKSCPDTSTNSLTIDFERHVRDIDRKLSMPRALASCPERGVLCIMSGAREFVVIDMEQDDDDEEDL